jgi:hypothetical protein
MKNTATHNHTRTFTRRIDHAPHGIGVKTTPLRGRPPVES